jgi:hypothetical protein
MRRASPWYFTTGESEDGAGHDEVRPSAFNGMLGGTGLRRSSGAVSLAAMKRESCPRTKTKPP